MPVKKSITLNEKKEINFRFWLIVSLIIFSTMIGIFLLFKSQKPAEIKSVTQKTTSLFPSGPDGIVIIKINGVIQFNEPSYFLETPVNTIEYIISKIKKYSKVKRIRGMVLRINSPGGTIAAVQELYNAILEFKSQGKIVVASMGDIAASGGYYIAVPANKIVANPGTITGSIGVIIASPSFTGLLNKIGVSYRVFKSGKFKDTLSPYREISEEEKHLIQEVVDDAYNQFYNAVKINRNLNDEKLRKYADGRIFTGRQAKEAGLIDELGDLSYAIRLTGKLTGLGDEPNIIYEKVSFIEQLFGFIEEKKSLPEKLLVSKFNFVPVYYLLPSFY